MRPVTPLLLIVMTYNFSLYYSRIGPSIPIGDSSLTPPPSLTSFSSFPKWEEETSVGRPS